MGERKIRISDMML